MIVKLLIQTSIDISHSIKYADKNSFERLTECHFRIHKQKKFYLVFLILLLAKVNLRVESLSMILIFPSGASVELF